MDEEDDIPAPEKQRASRPKEAPSAKTRHSKRKSIPDEDDTKISNKDTTATKDHAVKGDGSDDEMEYDDVIKKTTDGTVAITDAFAKKKQPNASTAAANGGCTKRRKKLVEQTTVGDDGYMRTESVTVWEDVVEDETNGGGEAPVAVASKSSKLSGGATKTAGSKSKKSSGSGAGKKKQAGLMGFFAKKK